MLKQETEGRDYCKGMDKFKGHLQGIMKHPGAGNGGELLLWLGLHEQQDEEFTEPRNSAVLVGESHLDCGLWQKDEIRE